LVGRYHVMVKVFTKKRGVVAHIPQFDWQDLRNLVT
jgi:hypothetical protein